MRYPILSRPKTEAIAGRLIAGDDVDFESERSWAGSGDDIDLTEIGEFLADRRTTIDSDTTTNSKYFEALEGEFAGDVHRALNHLPIDVLDDPGFWRYLSLTDFWWFIQLREQGPIARGNVMTYVDTATQSGTYCVPLRMYLRAQAIRDGDDYALAGAIPDSTDFWRSHILRTQTAHTPALSRAFARLQKSKRMTTLDVREFAKRINFLWDNVVFYDWTEAEADELLGGLYDEMFDDDRTDSAANGDEGGGG